MVCGDKMLCMNTSVDDVGSFPLPSHVGRKEFDKAYALAREAIIDGKGIRKDEFLLNNFYQVVVDSFRRKLASGLDLVTYPQHYDMHKQFIEVIHKAMEKGTYTIEDKYAIIPEIYVISQEAKLFSEEFEKKIALRVCVTGAMELYLREVGATPFKDILLMFAETVNHFAKNSILNSKYIKTEVVSLDEPSFGFQNVSADKDLLLTVLEKAFSFSGVTRQIHLHSSAGVANMLEVRNLDILSFEYAASPRNTEVVSKKMLEKADKQIRVGIARTDINSIVAELYDKGITKPGAEQLVESEESIRTRFQTVKGKYGERMTFAGPDCGLGGWPTQETAQLLLERTVSAVKSATD
jgi:5-methyltetrahydropteroyltriglutamate--homocysteine methyltransferase